MVHQLMSHLSKARMDKMSVLKAGEGMSVQEQHAHLQQLLMSAKQHSQQVCQCHCLWGVCWPMRQRAFRQSCRGAIATVLSGCYCDSAVGVLLRQCDSAVGLPSLSRVAALEHSMSCLLNCPSLAADCAFLALPALPVLLYSPSTSAVCYQVANLIERVPNAKQEAVKKYMHGTASCANFERVSVFSCVHMPIVCVCVCVCVCVKKWVGTAAQ